MIIVMAIPGAAITFVFAGVSCLFCVGVCVCDSTPGTSALRQPMRFDLSSTHRSHIHAHTDTTLSMQFNCCAIHVIIYILTHTSTLLYYICVIIRNELTVTLD